LIFSFTQAHFLQNIFGLHQFDNQRAILLFYFLLDQELILTRVLAWVPPRSRSTVERFTAEVDHLLGQYLRGQLGVMLAMAVFYSVALKLFGLGLALPIGIFTGLVICIPYVGFCLGLLLATLAALLQFEASHAFTVVLVVFGLGQLLEGFFLTPKWVGERIGLHPVAVIFALLTTLPIQGARAGMCRALLRCEGKRSSWRELLQSRYLAEFGYG
jgi:predicted PurR-regulated permease PerM